MANHKPYSCVPIVGYPGYFIEYDGTVWSTIGKSPRVLKPALDGGGYLKVTLGAGPKAQQLVHRLVAKAYIPNPGNLPCVLHKDDDRTNPHGDNLVWGTIKANNLDAHGKFRNKTSSKALEVEFENGTIEVYSSKKEACEVLGLSYSGLNNALASGRVKYKQYKVRYAK